LVTFVQVKKYSGKLCPPSNWYCLIWLCFMHYFSNF